MTPRAVLFDLYGTLIDIWTDERDARVWATLSGFLHDRGVPVAAAEIEHAYFDAIERHLATSPEDHPEVDIRNIFGNLLHRWGYRDPDALADEVTHLHRTLSIVRFRLYADVRESLEALRRSTKLGLISDAQRTLLEREVAMAGLDDLFDVVIVSSDYGYRKPDPRLFFEALDAIGVTAEEAIYVGDSVEHDICGAQAAGLQAVLLNHGDRSHPGPCLPIAAFDNIHDLQQWLSR